MSRDSICSNAPASKIMRKARIDLPIAKIVLERLHTGFFSSGIFTAQLIPRVPDLAKVSSVITLLVLQASSFQRVSQRLFSLG